jgi:uncharacterized protein (DUF2236 family)
VAGLPASLAMPGPLQRHVEALAQDFLMPAGAPQVDFAHPEREPALFAPDSVSWRVFKNPVSLFIGGVAAVLLELAEPRVRDGVWQHSSFRSRPLGRLQRTGLAAMVSVYGARSVAEAMIDGIVRMHGKVSGVTSEGMAYQANDGELLDWVQGTASFGFIQAWSSYVRPLSGADLDQAFAEALPAARLYGAHGAPRSVAEYDAMFAAMAPKLRRSAIIFEFLSLMRSVRAFPGPLRVLQPLLLKAAVELLPSSARQRLGLGRKWSLAQWERPPVKAIAGAADRLMLRSSPAVQSCRRLGLPDDYLYRH